MNKRMMSQLIAALSLGVAVAVSAGQGVQDGVQTHALNAKISANDKTGEGRSGIIAEYPTAFVVKEPINYPVVDKENTSYIDTVKVFKPIVTQQGE